jgi:HEPN domain-containing protein
MSRDHATGLLAMARKDATALVGMRDQPVVFADEVFGFHAQQAVEKALKAWIDLRGESYPKTHDLAHLLAALESMGEACDPWWPLVDLSVFAVQYRYEAFSTARSAPLEREGLVTAVEALLARVETLLG